MNKDEENALRSQESVDFLVLQDLASRSLALVKRLKQLGGGYTGFAKANYTFIKRVRKQQRKILDQVGEADMRQFLWINGQGWPKKNTPKSVIRKRVDKLISEGAE